MTTVTEFLWQAKALISSGRTYFSRRNDYDTVQALFDLGIEDRKGAWLEIMKLKPTDQYKPSELDRRGSGEWVWFFRKELNGQIAYIKLTIDQNLCLCLSFHPEGYTQN